MEWRRGQSHVWGDGIALVALVSTLSDIRRKCCHGRVREESLRRRREPGPGSRKVAVATVAGGTAPQTPPPSHYSPADSPHHHHHLHHRHPFSRHQALLRPSQNLLESSMNFLPGERRQFERTGFDTKHSALVGPPQKRLEAMNTDMSSSLLHVH